mmetsp:Transcript_22070/g.28574  ORF Transcript_22070/g.28574 Transcript_22070/m.28574 type:complete len:541 (+) Transcript_22070:107-1729(+)
MDWSSIYEDTGEENGEWASLYETRLSVLTHFFAKDHENGYTPLVCYFFAINFILGVGVLGMPFAFYASGIVLASLLVCLVTFLSLVTVLWNSEAMLRAEILGLLPDMKSFSPAFAATPVMEASSLKPGPHNDSPFSFLPLDEWQKTQMNGKRERAFSNISELEVLGGEGGTSKCYEVTELSKIYLGPWGKVCYQISLMGLMYVGLLAYSQVFEKTLLAQLPWELPTSVAAGCFMLIVVPLSCLDLREQITVQVAMSVIRFAAIAIMIFGSLYGIFYDPEDNGSASATAPYISDVKTSDFSGFGLMFSTVLFSQLFQHSVPGLIHPLTQKDKKAAPQIFFGALATTCFLYLVLGTSCSMYFGSRTESAVNINFSGFTWGVESPSPGIALLLECCTQLVVLFPGLDTLSVFPLIANTLGNNLASANPKFKRFLRRRLKLKLSKKKILIFWRLVSSIPPILASLVLTDLSLTFKYAGIVGIYVAFITPALLFWRSMLTCKRHQITSTTIYSWHFSKVEYAYVVLVISIVFLFVIVYQIVDAYR